MTRWRRAANCLLRPCQQAAPVQMTYALHLRMLLTCTIAFADHASCNAAE